MKDNEKRENDKILSFPEKESILEEKRRLRREKEKKKTSSAKKVLSLLVLIAFISTIVIFILNDTSFESTNQVNTSPILLSNANNYDYAKYLNGYIIARDGKISAYNTAQKLQWELKGSNAEPNLKCNGHYCLTYYYGDNIAVLTNGKNTQQIKTDGKISYGYVNKNGYSILFSSESGLKNKISIYDNNGKEIYYRQNADTLIPWAILSDDNYTLLTLELKTSNNKVTSFIRTFDIKDSDKAISSINLKDCTIAGCFFYDKKNFVIVKDDAMESYSVKGNKNWSVNYNKKKLAKFSYNDDGIICLLFNKDASAGSGSEVMFYRTSGNKISTYVSDKHIYDADICSKTAVLRLDRQLLMVNSKGKLIKSTDVAFDIKDSIFMGTKKCVFVLTTSEDVVLVEM